MLTSVEAFIICWNEEEIIRHTLNHYSKFCKKITLIDNYSADRTVEIAKDVFPEINVLQFDTNNEIRDDILTEVKNNCWKNSDSDYVIVCDSDELLYTRNITEQLSELKANNVALPIVIGYNMGAKEFPSDYQKPIYEQIVYGSRSTLYDKQIIFSPQMVKDINFGPGCHTCNPVFKIPRLKDSIVEFKLLHYKYLGKDYVYRKHGLYADRLSRTNIKNNWGLQYLDGDSHVNECFSLMDRHLYKVV